MSACRNCGEEVASTAHRCPHCGAIWGGFSSGVALLVFCGLATLILLAIFAA